jgi:hypothetical protein
MSAQHHSDDEDEVSAERAGDAYVDGDKVSDALIAEL